MPTTPASSSSVRSTTVSNSCSALTFSPGSTLRRPTTPLMGAVSAASRRPTLTVAACACADLTCARAASSVAREVSSAFGEMNFWFARSVFDACARSASLMRALAESTPAARSAARLCRSARSMRPSTCPAFTRLPSATFNVSSVPAALARTMAVRGAINEPENSMRSGIATSCGFTTSLGANSKVTSGFLSARSALLLTRDTAARASAATITAALPPMTQCLRMGDSLWGCSGARV